MLATPLPWRQAAVKIIALHGNAKFKIVLFITKQIYKEKLAFLKHDLICDLCRHLNEHHFDSFE